MTKEELVYRLASIFPRWMSKDEWNFFVSKIGEGGLELSEKKGWIPPPPPPEKGKVLDMGNTVSQTRPSNAPPPIVIDIRNYQQNKLLDAVLKKHREDKGTE